MAYGEMFDLVLITSDKIVSRCLAHHVLPCASRFLVRIVVLSVPVFHRDDAHSGVLFSYSAQPAPPPAAAPGTLKHTCTFTKKLDNTLSGVDLSWVMIIWLFHTEMSRIAWRCHLCS